MLPDFRFLIGAFLATGMLGVAGFGLATAVRLSHEARVGPSEATRSLAFDDRADWNQFADPELARRFELLARQPEESGAAPVPDAAITVSAPPPAVASSISEAPEGNEPRASTADTDTDVAMLTHVEEKPADFDQALPESAPLTAAVAPAAQEPAAVAPVAEPVAPPIVVADTGAPTTAEVAAPMAVEIAVAPTTVEVTAEPAAAERVASTSAALPDEPAEIAPPDPQLRTPLPKPKPKPVAKRPAKAKAAKAAKARPRVAAKPPAASTGYAAPNKNDPWGNGNFFPQ